MRFHRRSGSRVPPSGIFGLNAMIRVITVWLLLFSALCGSSELRGQGLRGQGLRTQELRAPAQGPRSHASNNICVRPGDQVWLVSARAHDVSSSCGLHCAQFAGGQWCRSDCQMMPKVGRHAVEETFVFVHGYNTDLEYAQKRGLQVYSSLFAQCQDRPPVRFVIWAWRSERDSLRAVRDYNMKSGRAIKLADKFAWTLNCLGPKPAIILGYSLGAQVAVSGLTQSCVYQGPPVQFSVIAAANDCSFASCTHLNKYGSIARTTVFLNERDLAIRAANLICRARYGKQYQTFEQLAPANQPFLGQLEIVDITGVASQRHSIVRYCELDIVRCRMNEMVKFNGCSSSLSGEAFSVPLSVPNAGFPMPLISMPIEYSTPSITR